MAHTETVSKEDKTFIFAVLSVVMLFLVVNNLLARRTRKDSGYIPKDKCLLPSARLGCKRKYADGSFDCMDCDWLKGNISSS